VALAEALAHTAPAQTWAGFGAAADVAFMPAIITMMLPRLLAAAEVFGSSTTPETNDVAPDGASAQTLNDSRVGNIRHAPR